MADDRNYRRDYYRRYRQRHAAEYLQAAQSYRENNRDAINTRQRNARQRNMEQSRHLNENEYLGETLSDDIPLLSIGTLSEACPCCAAFSFPAEHGRIKHNCCHHGKVRLADAIYPQALKDLLLGSHSDAVKFRQNIRSYNSSFAMAAFCPSQEISFKGISCIALKGDVNVKATTSLIPVREQKHRFAQIYIQDNDSALSSRISDKCARSVLELIQNIMERNPYAQVYRTLYDRYKEHPEEDIKLQFHRTLLSDQRRYNIPSSSASAEVAAVIVTGAGGEVPSNVDFVVYPKQEYQCQKLHKLSHHVEPMTFPLLFPNGDPGFSLNVANIASSQRITAVQYFGWRLRITDEFNVFTTAGRLTQQYILHGYITMEWNRLNYIRNHQNQFRRETINGLIDHVQNSSANTSDAVRLGSVVILPSSFSGSPRSMQQHFQDAMALSREVGRPDLFITFTANPQWPEIQDFLRSQGCNFNASDIPHVVVRAFYCRFETFIKEIAAGKVFGKILGYTFNIEFQKRGLPHAHCLFILNPRDKLLTPEALDRFISAEIPDRDNFPNLHNKVMKHMLHGPHSEATPCYNTSTGKCQKKFPFPFYDVTDMSGDGFPKYMRRDNRDAMHFYKKRLNNKLVPVDNSMVVPYNSYLLLKYDCHINVEYCGSVMAYKYIFKYVNKGHDRLKVTISNGLTNGNAQPAHLNEVDNYIDTRYVSSMEAAWRLLELPMHDHSHSIIRLPIHLPGHQYVTFEEGREADAVNSRNSVSQLLAFFTLNNEDPDARQWKYSEIPKKYVWLQKDRKWKKRQRGGEKVIVRLYAVSPRDTERFFLKYLLQNISGPCSFEDLKTIDGVECATFREAAYSLGFGDGDDKVEDIMTEVTQHLMPNQLRVFFAHLLLNCSQINGKKLWDKFKFHMCEGSDEHSCLSVIEQRLSSEDKTLSDFGLPQLSSFSPISHDGFSSNEHLLIAENMISKLNSEQRQIFEVINRSIDDTSLQDRLFFIDGPGGTGKTFLYKCLYHHKRFQNKNVLCVAWTGIAAILLPNGRTAHRIFKLPINMPSSEEDIVPIHLDKNSKKILSNVDLIIWDEASMIPEVALRLIDSTLKDLMKCDRAFGGKCILFGGDFRQVLPVLKRAGRHQLICGVIKSTSLWCHVKTFSLSKNMRADSVEFGNWLLAIGNGENEYLEISTEMQSQHLIHDTFGTPITEESISNCVVLAPLNRQVNFLNDLVLQKIPGDIIYCLSYDKATSCDGDETETESIMLRFQPEYLANVNVTGLPLHKLKLKIGAVVMLVRNLCVADGLCNGTRLIVRKVTKNALFCTVMTGSKAGSSVVIPRITLNTQDSTDLPFVLHRTQFPVRLAFAMTINKSQGQTFDKIGLYIDQDRPIFGHGQLYVALSRCRSKHGIKIQIDGAKTEIEKTNVKNIVYREVL